MPKESAVGKTDAKKHWAFQPVKAVTVPPLAATDRAYNEIDHFVLAKLEGEGLDAGAAGRSADADASRLFDLIGLPPTPEEVRRSARIRSPKRRTRSSSTLLASPHYGERWGRHWLDVARYADTKGYVFTEERQLSLSPTPIAITSSARSTTICRTTGSSCEQLAADQLALGEDNRPASAAMGFLTLGRRFSTTTSTTSSTTASTSSPAACWG